MKMNRLFLILTLATSLSVPVAYACDTGTVRDAAFHAPRDIFRMGMVFDEADAEAQRQYDALSAWFAEHGGDLNIRLESVAPGEAILLRHGYGRQEVPEKLPTTLLAGLHPSLRRPVTLTEWTPAPDTAFFEGLKTNPLLQLIARETAEYWGLILYARGVGPSRRGEVEKTIAHWRDTHAPGVKLVDVDRQDPDNEWLRTIGGIADDGEDWAGIVFAKGKLLLPVLVGSDITHAELDQRLQRLTIPCTCLQQAMTFGIDIPMFWDETGEARFTALTSPSEYMEMTLDGKLASIFDEMPQEQHTASTAAAIALGGGIILVVVFLAGSWLRR